MDIPGKTRMGPVSRRKAEPSDLALRILQHEQYGEVRELLVHGWTLAKAAEHVQTGLGLFNDIGAKRLERALSEIRDEIPPNHFVQGTLPRLHKQAVKTMEEGLDVLEELRELYRLQKERLDIDFNIEKNVRKLLPGTHREVKAAKDILRAYADVQMDFGLVQRSIGTVEVAGAVAGGNSVLEEIMGSPKKRQKLLSMSDRLLALAAKREREVGEEDEVIDVSPEKDEEAA